MGNTNAELARALGVKPPQISVWLKRGMPKEIERAKAWRMNHAPPRKGTRPPSETASTATTGSLPAVIPEGDMSWDARLQRAKEVELKIHQSMQSRIGTIDTATLQKLQATHLASIQEIAKIEVAAAEVRAASGELIHINTVRSIWAEVLPPLKGMIERLPMQERARCNPDHPHIAEQALKSAVHAILSQIAALETRF